MGMMVGILIADHGLAWSLSVACLLVSAAIFGFTLLPISRDVGPYIHVFRMMLFVFLGAGLAGLSGTNERAKLVQTGEYLINGEVVMAEVLRGNRQRIRFRPSQSDLSSLPPGDLRLIVGVEYAATCSRLWIGDESLVTTPIAKASSWWI